MINDLGTDFDRPDGNLGPDLRLLTSDTDKIRGWLQAQAERLQTPRGALWYDLDYGLDMRSYIGDDEDPAVAAHEINSELKKDERTSAASTDISVNADGSWLVACAVGCASDGKTYSLTFLVDASKTTLLTAT